jgi:hypothetical protein
MTLIDPDFIFLRPILILSYLLGLPSVGGISGGI